MTDGTDNTSPIFCADGKYNAWEAGLTKREYFAAQICAALCANPHNSTLDADEQIAFVAVQQANMLIEALNR